MRRNTLTSVILWSVISAAFIGPGTVTTAVSAGTQYGLQLLWAVVLATLGCIALQEISARITIASGLTLGESLVKKFGARKGVFLQWLIGGSVVLGCAAYEAGNILGAMSGLQLITGLRAEVLTFGIALAAGIILWTGGRNWISTLMMILVGLMGVAFAALAFSQPLSLQTLLSASVTPVIPAGAELLVLGLVGTTIVPYNIFIGAGISKGETIPLMRIGLSVSVAIGGLITAAILIAGTSVKSFSSFGELSTALGSQVGAWGSGALAWGLFAAGFSSAITSPYATSIIASSVFGITRERHSRLAGIAVLIVGFTVAISGLQPIPVILAVQAINGLILPLLTLFLLLIVNDPLIMPLPHRHGKLYNIALLVIFFAVLLIGLNNLDKSASTLLHLAQISHLALIIILSALITLYTAWRIFKR